MTLDKKKKKKNQRKHQNMQVNQKKKSMCQTHIFALKLFDTFQEDLNSRNLLTC